LKKQRNCKICREQWIANAILYLHHCERASYREIIERMKTFIDINEYNISVHLHRHVQEIDIIEAEQKQARWAKIESQLSTT
jgi:hypothetical protein